MGLSLSKGGVSMTKASNGSASANFDATIARADEALFSKKLSALLSAGVEMALLIQKQDCAGAVPEVLIEKTYKIVCLLEKQRSPFAVDLSRRLIRFAKDDLQDSRFASYIQIANDLLLPIDPDAYVESVSRLMTEHNEREPVVSERLYRAPYQKTFKLHA